MHARSVVDDSYLFACFQIYHLYTGAMGNEDPLAGIIISKVVPETIAGNRDGFPDLIVFSCMLSRDPGCKKQKKPDDKTADFHLLKFMQSW